MGNWWATGWKKMKPVETQKLKARSMNPRAVPIINMSSLERYFRIQESLIVSHSTFQALGAPVHAYRGSLELGVKSWEADEEFEEKLCRVVHLSARKPKPAVYREKELRQRVHTGSCCDHEPAV